MTAGRRTNVPGPLWRADLEPWLPTDLGSALVLWLRADKGVTIGTGVSAWADQSGNGHNATQATGSKQPTPGVDGSGLSYLDFASASSQYLSVAGMAEAGTEYTFVCVVDPGAMSGYQNPFSCNNGANEFDFYSYHATGAKVAFSEAPATKRFGMAATAGLQAIMWELDSGGSQTIFSRDGGAPTTDGYTGASATGVANIGKHAAAAQYFDGWIYEAFLLSRLLTAAEKASLDEYRSTRYGL